MTVDLRIADPDWTRRVPRIRTLCRHAAKATMMEEGVTREIGVLLTDDDEMARLNARWRGVCDPTDVLAFETATGDYAGDVALGFTTVQRDAASLERTLSDHAAHLIVHGVLHLLGHDHHTDEATVRMREAEARILSRIGIANPWSREAER